jgi:hypothetical protein
MPTLAAANRKKLFRTHYRRMRVWRKPRHQHTLDLIVGVPPQAVVAVTIQVQNG